MTTDTPSPGPCRDRQGPRPQGRRPPGHRPDELDRQHHRCPACCTWPSLRSPHAHARITPVDVSAATAMPGVVAAFSGADFAGEQGSLPCAWPVTPDIVIPDHPPMATDRGPLRRRGRGLSWSRETATKPRTRRAAIDVDYEPLPAGARHAGRAGRRLAPGARRRATRATSSTLANGDVDAAFRDAPVVDRAQLPAAAADPDRDGAPRRWSARRPVTSSPSGRPPRSRTSCAPCSPW